MKILYSLIYMCMSNKYNWVFIYKWQDQNKYKDKKKKIYFIDTRRENRTNHLVKIQMELVLMLFTLGYIAQFAGNYLLIMKIRKQKSIEGLSFETQIIYLIGSLVRCIWVFDTRLTSNFLVWIELLLSVASYGYLVYLLHLYKDTKIHHVENPYKFIYLLLGSVILSIFFHPGSKG